MVKSEGRKEQRSHSSRVPELSSGGKEMAAAHGPAPFGLLDQTPRVGSAHELVEMGYDNL